MEAQAPTKPSEVLEAAADLLTPEGAWTQDSHARDKHGHRIAALAKAAVCWCMRGAINRVAGGEDPAEDARMWLIRRAAALGLGRNYVDFNDDPARTQAEVVEALRKAAELARSEGQ